MSNPIISLSPSSVSDIVCPFKFNRLRVMKQWPKQSSFSINSARGTAFHDIMAEVYDPAYGSTVPHHARLPGALDKAIAGLHLLDDESRSATRSELTALAWIYMDSAAGDFKVLGVEVEDRVSLASGGTVLAELRGRLDRVQVPYAEPDTLVIIDLSLSAKRPADESIWVSLALGRHAFPGYRKHRFEIHTVTCAGLVIERYPAGAFKGTHKIIIEAAAEFAAFSIEGVYPARIGEACRYCACESHCPLRKPVDAQDLAFEDEE